MLKFRFSWIFESCHTLKRLIRQVILINLIKLSYAFKSRIRLDLIACFIQLQLFLKALGWNGLVASAMNFEYECPSL
jgi:hypothetical protein